jgi:hypothetical protein
MEAEMANWVECKDYNTGQLIYVNLDMIVSVSGNGRATVLRYSGGDDAQIIVEGDPKGVVAGQVVH